MISSLSIFTTLNGAFPYNKNSFHYILHYITHWSWVVSYYNEFWIDVGIMLTAKHVKQVHSQKLSWFLGVLQYERVTLVSSKWRELVHYSITSCSWRN